MQPSQCQLPLDESPQMFQATTPCDQALTLDMAQLSQETFPTSLYDICFSNVPTLIPVTTMSSAMPIPKQSATSMMRYDFGFDRSTIDQLDLELMAVTSDLGLEDPLSSFGYDQNFDNPLSPGIRNSSPENLKHVLSIGKRSLAQEPTLAQLNANELEEPFFDNLDFDIPGLLSEEKSEMIPLGDFDGSKLRWESEKTNSNQSVMGGNNITQELLSSSFPSAAPKETTTSVVNSQEEKKPDVASLMDIKPLGGNGVTTPIKKQSTLHDLLTQNRTKAKVLPFATELSPSSSSRLSSSAPTQQSCFEQMWSKHQQACASGRSGSLVEEVPKIAASTSTGDVNSPKEEYDSNDEGFDSEPEDSDHYDEMSSDADSTVSDDYDIKRTRSMNNPDSKSGKKERFFWQYNVQAKGPKINRLSLSPCNTDPHTLNEVTDPVFSPNCYVQGIKHSGKARRGDGNDLTPNPRKLYQIGLELKRLNKVINDLTPVSELPFNARPKSRKEKNKLASRACRLKKKAQHEANKLKLYGLEQEHRKLLVALKETRQLVTHYLVAPEKKAEEDIKLVPQLENIAETAKSKIAGHTADFVNEIIDSIAAGKSATALENM